MEDKYKEAVLNVPPTQINFCGSDRDEPVVCSEFTCGKHLSITEILAGTKCINHQNKKQAPDASRFVSYPRKRRA